MTAPTSPMSAASGPGRRTGSGTERTTVAIVGAGPAGLVAALILQREGIPFVLLERHLQDELRAYPKAGLVEHRTVELLGTEGIAGPILAFEQENHRCEFRTPDERILFDYGALTGGRPHFVYPQHELVAKLCEVVVAGGGDVRFGHEVTGVDRHDGAASLRVAAPPERTVVVEAEAVLGCDGVRGAVAGALPSLTAVDHELAVRWLAVIAEAPPLVAHTIYAPHPRGFAGHMRRTPSLTRYYLEVPAADPVEAWPVERIRDELSTRLGLTSELDGVGFVERSLLDLRMRMLNPIQDGPVLLAGDAAHLITPAAGKGMNLAIQDAVELAHGLVERFGPRRDGARLAAYSATRLPAIWRTQAFSEWMLRLLVAGAARAGSGSPAVPAAGAGPPSFEVGVRQGWVAALGSDPLLARWFAHAYAGAEPR